MKTKRILMLSLLIIFASCKKEELHFDSDYNLVEATKTSLKVQGHMYFPEPTPIAEIGLCWSEVSNPTVSDNHYSTTGSWELSHYCLTHTLEGLKPETAYHVRVYAVNGSEYLYGDDICVKTMANGLFTVDQNRWVRFAKGNLQYQASTNTWRFAEHQWDYIGYSEPDQHGFVYGTVEGSSNHLVGPDYDGWIDLFGWGTSGHDHGAVCYQPWSTSENDANYYAYGSAHYNLYEWEGQADWGSNPIVNGGNQPNLWRTLSFKEWEYLLQNRKTASGIRYAAASVNGLLGTVILPDDWDDTIYPLNTAPFEINSISLDDWYLLEENGAVFLPPTGCRTGKSVSDGYQYGGYWSSSKITSFGTPQDWAAWNFRTSYGNIYFEESHRHYGLSVRLVQDY